MSSRVQAEKRVQGGRTRPEPIDTAGRRAQSL